MQHRRAAAFPSIQTCKNAHRSHRYASVSASPPERKIISPDGADLISAYLDSVYTSQDLIANQRAMQRIWTAAMNEAVVLA